MIKNPNIIELRGKYIRELRRLRDEEGRDIMYMDESYVNGILKLPVQRDRAVGINLIVFF